MKIPPNSIYYKNFDNSANDQMSNWTPILSPLPTDFDNAVSLKFSVEGALKLDLAGSFMDILSAEIGIALAAPTFTGLLKTFNDEDPCQDPSGELGNSLEVDVGMALKAYEVATLDVFGAEAKAEQTFFSTAYQIYSTCMAVDVGAQPTAVR